MLSGATGQLYGNKWTWQFLPRLAAAHRHERRHAARLRHEALRRPTVVRARPGPAAQGRDVRLRHVRRRGTVNDSQYVTAASTPDGRLAIAYLPDVTELTVDLSTFSGPVRAEWYDPSAGRYRPAARALLPNKGKHRFIPPRRNHEGTSAWGTVDWVLVLTAGS